MCESPYTEKQHACVLNVVNVRVYMNVCFMSIINLNSIFLSVPYTVEEVNKIKQNSTITTNKSNYCFKPESFILFHLYFSM